MQMLFGVDVPNHGEYSDPHVLLELAFEAESAGWDGFFIWDHILKYQDNRIPLADTWSTLCAIAAVTDHIRLGPMVTPLARRRPWKVARETVTLDHLSRGRLILGVGLGMRSKAEFEPFGDQGDPKIRGEMLDESLVVINNFWVGEEFSFSGKHYQLKDVRFLPRPYQSPRIPIWVAGTWPNKKPFRRAAAWDGAFPMMANQGLSEMMPLNMFREVIAYTKKTHHLMEDFDFIHLGISSGASFSEDLKIVKDYQQAGMTWWLENLNPVRGSLAKMRKRIRSGPIR